MVSSHNIVKYHDDAYGFARSAIDCDLFCVQVMFESLTLASLASGGKRTLRIPQAHQATWHPK